jgi:hypothetical protein
MPLSHERRSRSRDDDPTPHVRASFVAGSILGKVLHVPVRDRHIDPPSYPVADGDLQTTRAARIPKLATAGYARRNREIDPRRSGAASGRRGWRRRHLSRIVKRCPGGDEASRHLAETVKPEGVGSRSPGAGSCKSLQNDSRLGRESPRDFTDFRLPCSAVADGNVSLLLESCQLHGGFLESLSPGEP